MLRSIPVFIDGRKPMMMAFLLHVFVQLTECSEVLGVHAVLMFFHTIIRDVLEERHCLRGFGRAITATA